MLTISKRNFLKLMSMTPVAGLLFPNITFANVNQNIATTNYIDSMIRGLDIKASVKKIYNYAEHDVNWMNDIRKGDRVLFINRRFNRDAILTFNGNKWVVDKNDEIDDGSFTFVEYGKYGDTGWVFSGRKFVKFSCIGGV